MWELYRPPQFHSQNREYFGVFGAVDFGQTVDGTVVIEREKSGFRDIECDSFGTASPGVRDQWSGIGKAPLHRLLQLCARGRLFSAKRLKVAQCGLGKLVGIRKKDAPRRKKPACGSLRPHIYYPETGKNLSTSHISKSRCGNHKPHSGNMARIPSESATLPSARSIVHRCVPGRARQDAINCASVSPIPFDASPRASIIRRTSAKRIRQIW